MMCLNVSGWIRRFLTLLFWKLSHLPFIVFCFFPHVGETQAAYCWMGCLAHGVIVEMNSR